MEWSMSMTQTLLCPEKKVLDFVSFMSGGFWRYTMDHSSTGNWELIHTISLRQVFGSNADPTWCSQGADVRVAVVGDNADFVFFSIQKKVFYLHISSRTVKKVYELAQRESLSGVSPFVMVWPPTFPTLNGGHDNDEWSHKVCPEWTVQLFFTVLGVPSTSFLFQRSRYSDYLSPSK